MTREDSLFSKHNASIAKNLEAIDTMMNEQSKFDDENTESRVMMNELSQIRDSSVDINPQS